MSDFGLVMPFVTVASVGGPHDDDAFVIGYECGTWDERLRASENLADAATVHTAALPQLDLIAMRHGFLMRQTETEVEGWTGVEFLLSAVYAE